MPFRLLINSYCEESRIFIFLRSFKIDEKSLVTDIVTIAAGLNMYGERVGYANYQERTK
jgi:hypothetical protein